MAIADFEEPRVTLPSQGRVMRAHHIRLSPNNVQATGLSKAAGVARFAYNWALEEWQR